MTTALDRTVGNWVAERASRARVFERLGIDYCCGGKKPLQEVCREKNLDYDTVVSQLQDENLAPVQGERNWASASITDLCDHVEQTHHAYLKEELPRLAALATKVANRHGDKQPALVDMRNIFIAMKDELEAHMMKEERILFPLCRHLDVSGVSEAAQFGGIERPIEVMIREHEDAGDALVQIRRLADDYTCPPGACMSYQALFDALQQFERDMHEHVHKENNILFPKAIRLEKLIATKSRATDEHAPRP